MTLEKQNFGNLTNLLLRAGIIDNTYPVPGCFVWMPDGFELKNRTFSMIEDEIKTKGYQRYQFPRIVPGSSIRKVTQKIDDFEDGLFWLRTKDGKAIDQFLNPTGECGIYTMLKKWIRDESQLPMKIYQIGSTFRPHKRPDALLNGDELSNLLEAHSAFASKNEADREFMEMFEILKKIHDNMGLPYLALHRPLRGNKPVCTEMISFETFLPSKNRSFNVGVHYNQGQIYSRAFDVRFNKTTGEKDNTHQVTFGISERGLAAMLDLHKDEQGLRMFPQFAPTQIMVFPVFGGEATDAETSEYAEKVYSTLAEAYRSRLDLTNRKASKKLADGRLRGIPIRIGVSAEDLKNQTARVYLRTQEMPLSNIPVVEITKNVKNYMAKVEYDIAHHATNILQSKIHDANCLRDATEIVSSDEIARLGYCGNDDCFNIMERQLPGELIGTDFSNSYRGKCLGCGSEVMNPSFYAKRGSSP